MDIVSQNAEPAGVASAGKNTEEGARTLDLWIHNPVLYQLSYLGIRNLNILFYDTQTLKQRPSPTASFRGSDYGAEKGRRRALCRQASGAPET
jgi:hypothetical protein